MTEVLCCVHGVNEHGSYGCRGWNLSGGASGMLQQCGCRTVPDEDEVTS